jgi:UvrD/REP helicase N-terminal domain/UvrD-like helicase C-terminal domain
MQCSVDELARMVENASEKIISEVKYELNHRSTKAASRLASQLSAGISGQSVPRDPAAVPPKRIAKNKNRDTEKRPKFPPTAEQQDAIEKFDKGGSIKITAFAGAGKTSTLQFLADRRSQRGLYLAFNKSIALEAKSKFPEHVDCRTTHSIAVRYVRGMHKFSRGKLFDAINANQLAEVLGIQGLVLDANTELSPVQLAYLILQTIKKFCNSDDYQFGDKHVDLTGRLRTTAEAARSEAVDWVVRKGNTVWHRMLDVNDPIPLGHDGYLKLWSLSRPSLDYNFIFVDEAQDTNPAVLSVLSNQPHAQIVYVGDRHQQIYEWRGAINAMSTIDTSGEAALTQSFRFGAAIAKKASQVLRTLGEPNELHGNEKIRSAICEDKRARAVLARTNATVISEALRALENNRKPHIIGGTHEYRDLLQDVQALMEGRPGQRPEFFGYKNWSEVVASASTEEGEPIRRFVTLVQTNGIARLWKAVLNSVDDENASDVVVSTAHKSKGREWTSVRIAEDFSSCTCEGGKISDAEVRLFYVAMTRAQEKLCIDPKLLNAFCTRKASDLEDARQSLQIEMQKSSPDLNGYADTSGAKPQQKAISRNVLHDRLKHDGEAKGPPNVRKADDRNRSINLEKRALVAAAAKETTPKPIGFLARLLGK